MQKSLSVVDEATAKANVSDIQTHGNPMAWVCLCKASSKDQGWMKSTKAVEVNNGIGTFGCLVQTTTQQRNADLSWSLCDALIFVPGITIADLAAVFKTPASE